MPGLSCLSLVVVLCASASFFTLWVSFMFSFLLWHTLPLLCLSSLLSLPSALLRFLLFDVYYNFFLFLYSPLLFLSLWLLSPGNFCFRSRDRFFSPSFYLSNYLSLLAALPVLLSPWFYLLVVFTSASSFFPLGLLRLAFRTPYSILGWSIFASSLYCHYYWIRLFLSFVSPFAAFLQEFPLTFATVFCLSVVCFTRLCGVTYGSPFLLPFASFALASGLRCFTCDSFASFEFLLGFLSFTSFLFGSFASEFR